MDNKVFRRQPRLYPPREEFGCLCSLWFVSQVWFLLIPWRSEIVPQDSFEFGRRLHGELTTTLLRLLLLATIKLNAGMFPEASNMVLQRIPGWGGLGSVQEGCAVEALESAAHPFWLWTTLLVSHVMRCKVGGRKLPRGEIPAVILLHIFLSETGGPKDFCRKGDWEPTYSKVEDCRVGGGSNCSGRCFCSYSSIPTCEEY